MLHVHERRLLIGLLLVSGACTSSREGEAAGTDAGLGSSALTGVSESGSGNTTGTTETGVVTTGTSDGTAGVGESAGGKFDVPGPSSEPDPSDDGGSGWCKLVGECNPTSATEVVCDDFMDDDCDGMPDCQDTDCLWNNTCLSRGCFPGVRESCGQPGDEDCDGFMDCGDPDCKNDLDCLCNEQCILEGVRWCDTPARCSWGKQVCTPQGTWGPCVETPTERPPGCEGTEDIYDTACCLNAPDDCCQDFPRTRSVGECEGVAECMGPPADDPEPPPCKNTGPGDEPTGGDPTDGSPEDEPTGGAPGESSVSGTGKPEN